MESFDYDSQFERMKTDVATAFRKVLDVRAAKTGLHLRASKVWVDDNLGTNDWKSQQEAVVKDKTWGVPVYASVDLIDTRNGGKIISTAKKVKVAELPKNTAFGSFIVNGKHYQVSNQMRRKPGAYITTQENGQKRAEFHIAGRPFKVMIDNKTSAFKLDIGGKAVPLYPILSRLGISDSAMAKAWGQDVLDGNKGTSAKDANKAIIKAGKYFSLSSRDASFSTPEEAATSIGRFLSDNTQVNPWITKTTLGKEFSAVTPEAIMLGARELSRASANKRETDDSEALEFKKVFGVSDILRERIMGEDGELSSYMGDFRKKILRKLESNKGASRSVTSLVGAQQLTPAIESFFMQSSLSNTTDQTNPINMMNGTIKITTLGEGGITKLDAIPEKEKALHPSTLGFIDPIHTPDSSNIGVTLNLPVGVTKKGDTLYTSVIDAKTGKDKKVSPQDARNMVISFADQYENGKPISSKVKAIVNGQHTLIDAKKVDAVYKNPKLAFSVSSNTIPFLASTGGVRAQMASKMIEQAIPLARPEAPLVQVKAAGGTVEGAIGEGFSGRAPVDGVIKSVTKNKIVISANGKDVDVDLYSNMPLNNKAFIDSRPTVKAGDRVGKGDTIFDSNFTDNGTLALGTNLRAAYIPWKGYNFEDGIVITESAREKLTSEHMHQMEFSKSQSAELGKSKYFAKAPSGVTVNQLDTLDDDGVVKKGTIVNPGDPLWVGVKNAKSESFYAAMSKLGKSVSPIRGVKEEWTSDYPGEVVNVVKTGGGVKVFVKTMEPAQIGDKLTNRLGAKGIITKIIPDAESPHTADGRPIDILLNPHGIVTRINPSQILETAAGKIAEKQGKPYVVDNFGEPDHAAAVNSSLKKAGIQDTEVLYDPDTKKPLGNVLVGSQYILKLGKQAATQFSARSDGRYDINMSPARGGDDGAKALDQLAFYSLLSHGARANIKEMATFKATNSDQFWNWFVAGPKLGLIRPKSEPTFAYKKFESYLKGAGVSVDRNGSMLTLGPLTDSQTESMSSGEIFEPLFMRAKDLREENGGLLDPKVTGGATGSRWGHYELAEPMPNPAFEDPIKKIANLKPAEYDSLVSGRIFVDPETGEFAESGITGGAAIKARLDRVNVDEQIRELTDKAKQSTRPKSLDEINKKLKYLHGLKKSGLTPGEAYVQTKIPIIPPQYRRVMAKEDGSLSVPGINNLYRDVGLLNNELKWQNEAGFIGDEVKQGVRRGLYDGMKALAGLGTPIATYAKKREPKGFISAIGGQPIKSGFFQHEILRRRQDVVARGTIIPEPKLGIDEVGLPEDISWEIFSKFVEKDLISRIGMSPIDAAKAVVDRSPTANLSLRHVMTERPVMLNRAPSLHKFSMMAFRPQITDGKAIKIPPLVVKGFNADFDGDAMNVHVPVMPDAVKEAYKMMPSANLFNPGTGGVMIAPQNEATLGLFLMSSNPSDRARIIEKLPESIRSKYSSKILNKSLMSELMKDIAGASPSEHGKIVAELKELGDDHAYKSGFTVGMKDIAPKIPERDAIIRDITKKIGKLDLLSEKGRDAGGKIVADGGRKLTDVVRSRMSDGSNNLGIMVNSGARGNFDQLKQIVSTPLMLDDHKGRVIPIPVKNSFSEGLDFSDYWSTLYGARSTAVDKQEQTKNPGAFNKDIMATSIVNVISSADCGADKGLKLPLMASGRVRNADLEDRFLAKDVSIGGAVIARAGEQVTTSIINKMVERKVGSLEVRSPITCRLPRGICAKCYGVTEKGSLPEIGENVGATSGMAMSEPLTQMTMRTFHTGGISGTRNIIDGYQKIDALFKMHDLKTGAATLATRDGKVERIAMAPGGLGRNVTIGGVDHFVDENQWDKELRTGRTVKKGDVLSLGIVQPKDMLPLKGMIETQSYMSGQVQGAFEGQNVPLKRRAVETVIRALGNTTKIVDPGNSTFLPGDIAPYTVVEHFNSAKAGKLMVDDAIGHIAAEDNIAVKKGEPITDRVAALLDKAGIKEIEVGNQPIKHEEFISGVRRVPALRGDWMAQLGYQRAKDAIVGGAARGDASDLHGLSPIPAYAYGAEFGDDVFGKPKGGY